jgi:hypothetical protein
LHLVGYTWKYVCDARTHKHQIYIDSVVQFLIRVYPLGKTLSIKITGINEKYIAFYLLLINFILYLSEDTFSYRRIIYTESVSSCTTSCSASLTFLTNFLFLLRDNNYSVSGRLLALSRLWLQKQSDARAYKFAQCPALLHHQHRLAKVTCAWSWRLCGITPTLLTLHTYNSKGCRSNNLCPNFRYFSWRYRESQRNFWSGLPMSESRSLILRKDTFSYRSIISTESVSSCTTTCSASLTVLTNLLFLLRDNNYSVRGRLLALSRLWLQKQSDARAYKFAQCPALFHHQHRLAKLTCAWRRRLCGITPTALTLQAC